MGGLEGCCCGNAHQTLDELLQLLLGLLHRRLCSNHSDELLVFVVGSGEDDPGASAVADLADISATFSNQELVVLGFGTQLSGVALCLLPQESGEEKKITSQ